MMIPLGDVISLQKGKKPKIQSKEPLDGYLPNIDIKAFEQGKYEYYTDGVGCLPCEEGDILIVCDGSRSGLVGIAKKGVVGSTLAKITISSCVDKKFLLYFIQSHYTELNTNMKGTGTPHVNPALLLSFPFPVVSESQQKRIVEKIDALFSELDKGVEMFQTIRQQLRTYRQAVLKWAFDRESMVYRPLTDLGDFGRGKSKHRPRNDPQLFFEGKYPFVQTGEVKAASGVIKDSTTKYGEFGLAQSKLWSKGTLCITIAANIAETAFLGIEACFPDSVVGFTADESVVLPKYVDYFIQSAKQRLWYYAPATAQKNINLTTLENLTVPYCSLSEQEKIVSAIESRLSVCDKLEQLVEENIAKSQALRQSILKKAFVGQLVPQDPNDEPAENF
jgi:type I restriction enzyme S subunit